MFKYRFRKRLVSTMRRVESTFSLSYKLTKMNFQNDNFVFQDRKTLNESIKTRIKIDDLIIMTSAFIGLGLAIYEVMKQNYEIFIFLEWIFL